MDIQLFLSIILWLSIGTATAYLANQRGRDPWIWFMVGMLLGLIGLLILFLLPAPTKEKSSTPSEEGEFILHETEPAPPAPVPLDLWYYYDRSQAQQGPVQLENLKNLYHKGDVTDTTYLWCEGMPDWKVLTDLPELQTKLK
jgi:hypothetical protein